MTYEKVFVDAQKKNENKHDTNMFCKTCEKGRSLEVVMVTKRQFAVNSLAKTVVEWRSTKLEKILKDF